MQQVILLLFILLEVSSARVLEIGNKDFYNLSPLYEYSDDITSDQKFWKQKHDYVDNKYQLHTATYQPYWIHFKLKNNTNTVKDYLLLSERGYTFSLDYYLVKEGKLLEKDSDDFFSQAKSTPFKATHRIFPIHIDTNETLDVYFKVENCNRVDIPFKLVNYRYLSEYNLKYHLFQGVFFATILIMAFYNMIVYFITKHRPYLYYVLYSLMLIMYQGSYFGYLHFLTNLDVKYIYMIMMVGSIGFVIALVYFIRELFTFDYKINKFFSVLVVVLFFEMLGLLVSDYLEIHFYLELFFNLVNITIPIYVSLVLYSLYHLFYKQKNYLILYYAIVWTIVAFFGLLLILTHVGVISTDLGVEYLFEISMMVESFLLAVLLAYRIKEIEKEKEQQQSLLMRQNRLASMGEMINMIAHQWRQPLAEINGVIMSLDVDYRKKSLSPMRFNAYLDDVEALTKYLSKTIGDFMNFFNTNKPKELFSLNELIVEMKSIINKRLKSIHLEVNMEDNILLEGYRSELLQVLLIIINNAIDACLSESEDRNFKIKLDIEESKEYLKIRVFNNGGNIPQVILDKIFDPYFTTKHQSKGTGLGLYILKMIVEQRMLGEVKIDNFKEGIVVELNIPWSKRILED
jgi:signal transduction histidine kinase